MAERLLITGGAGFIGSNFVRQWLADHPGTRLVVLDKLSYAGRRENLAAYESDPRFRFVHGDILDQTLIAGLLREERLDTIVHFAAESHVDRSIDSPEPFTLNNVMGTQRLLEAAREVWLRGDGIEHRFHHVSTDEVYGDLPPDAPPAVEGQAYRPSSPYAASKAASDHLVRAYARTYGLQATLSHCCNNFGPYQFPEKFIPRMLINLLLGQPLPVYGDGGQVRDWIHVDEHNRALALILARGKPGETYHIGVGCERDNLATIALLCTELAALIETGDPRCRAYPALRGCCRDDLLGRIAYVTDRPGHDRRYAIDAGKLARELGFAPRIGHEQALCDTVSWYLDHQHWWRPLL